MAWYKTTAHRPQTTDHEPTTIDHRPFSKIKTDHRPVKTENTDHITNRPPPAPTIKTTDHRPNQKFTPDQMEDRPQTTDQIKHRPSTRLPTTDQSPRNVAKVRKQTIYLFSIALVDFCDNFTSNTAVSSRARWRYTKCIRLHWENRGVSVRGVFLDISCRNQI